MGEREELSGEGWSKAEADWLNSLPIEDATDLFWIAENGPDNEKDAETLERLREGYAEATGSE